MRKRLSPVCLALVTLTVAAQEERFYASGFTVETVASGLHEPVALEFAPDGRLFVAERNGAVQVVSGGVVRPEPVAVLDVVTENENGLLGMALDPDFAQTGHVYLFATVSTKESMILRVTAADTRDSEPVVIRDLLPTRGTFHSGGGLRFGPDGMLYFSIGDNLVKENGQDLSTLAGKIARIQRDGTTPADNPFRTPTGAPRAVYALGFRNPFRFCFAPDGRMFALDVGSDNEERREEINLVRAGGNYGWPLAEGIKSPDAPGELIDPIVAYSDGGAAPVGAVVYSGSQFPPEYAGDLFHLEYVLNRLYRVQLDGDVAASHTLFMEGGGGMLDLAQGPDGALYYCELDTGLIKRISSTTVVAADVDAAESAPLEDARLPALCGAGSLSLLVLGVAAFVITRPGCPADRRHARKPANPSVPRLRTQR